MERAELATLLGVGRSYASRVMQTFKAEGILETRRGSILVRNPDSLRVRSCLCNEAVKNHFEEVFRGVYPDPEKGNWAAAKRLPCRNRLTNSAINPCFLTFSEYIAPQRVGCARSFWPGFLFGTKCPPNFRF
jgi:hypothetical protein